MASIRDDDYSRLAQSVDEWVAELSQARSALAESLNVRQSQRPAFRLSGDSIARREAAPPEPHVERDLDAETLLFARVADSERTSRETQHELARVQAELDFAREQLHVQNRLRLQAEEKWTASERELEATMHALGRAQISLDELRRQLRGKEWALENAKGDLDTSSDSGAESPRAAEELKQTAAALQSRLDALTIEFDRAREQSSQDRESLEEAQEKRAQAEQEALKSREIIDELSQEVQRYADELRRTGREFDETQEALTRGGPSEPYGESSLGEVRLALQYAELRNKELTAALDAAERAAHERLGESMAESAVVTDNFDALASSHLVLRDHITELQQELVARDHEIARLRASIAEPTVSSSKAGDVTDTKLSDVVENLESDAIGNAYLVQALRRELEAARESLEQSELDRRLLTQALRAEVEGLRSLAAERDFVIHHQEAQLEGNLLGTQAKPTPAEAPDMNALCEELAVLRQRVEDKDAVVHRLRSQLAESEARLASADDSEVDELRAVIRHREADLERTHERVAFLRRALRDLQFDKPAKQHETSPNIRHTDQTSDVSLKQSEASARKILESDTEIDVSRYQANATLQREVEQSLAFREAWPLLAIVIGLAGIGVLALTTLAFLLI